MKKPYPLVRDFAGVLNRTLVEERGEQRAIDVLAGPIEAFTDLPERMERYLERNKDKDVLLGDIFNVALDAGYDQEHIWRVIKEFFPKRKHIGMWYDTKSKKNYLRWYDLKPGEQEQLEQDSAWFDSL